MTTTAINWEKRGSHLYVKSYRVQQRQLTAMVGIFEDSNKFGWSVYEEKDNSELVRSISDGNSKTVRTAKSVATRMFNSELSRLLENIFTEW